MSPELVAALVGAVAGGIIAVLGGIAQVFIQGWISERGEITCDVVAWTIAVSFRELTSMTDRVFTYTAEGHQSWEDALQSWNKVRGVERGVDADPEYTDYEVTDVGYSFTANFLNTKGTNAALLEYWVQFKSGDRTLASSVPGVTLASTTNVVFNQQAVALPAESVTATA